jgi:hypothetical protein
LGPGRHAFDPEGENKTYILFPVWWIACKSRRKLEDPDNSNYSESTRASLFITMKSRIWLGYQLDPQSFESLVKTLVKTHERDDIDALASRYVAWKMSLPDKVYNKVPDIRCA